MDHPAPLIRCKEECLVLLDRPAESSAKLVLLVIGTTGVKVTLRIEQLVAQELIYAAMPTVSPRLGDHINDGAGVASVLCVKGIGKDAELLDAVGRRLNGGRVDEQVVAIPAVDVEVVGAPTA